MINTKTIMSCLLLCISSVSLAMGESMILTRTYVDVINDENQLKIIAHDQGQVELSFPQYHSFYGDAIRFNNIEKSTDLFSKAARINHQLNAKDLAGDLAQAKADSQSLFYSSDSDIIHLAIKKDQRVTWEITLSGLQELKHYAHQLDRWQPLIELIDAIEDLSKDEIVAPTVENRHEK